MNIESEAKLLDVLRQGTSEQQRRVIRIIYDHHHRDIYSYICSKSKCENAAKDIFADVWLDACIELPNLEFGRDPKNINHIRAFLLRVAQDRLQEVSRSKREESQEVSLFSTMFMLTQKIAEHTTILLISTYSKYITQEYRDDLAFTMEEERHETCSIKQLLEVTIQSNLWLIWDIFLAHTIDRLVPSRRQNR